MVDAACRAWCAGGWKDPTIWSRVRILRSAVGWAYRERLVAVNPLDGIRQPPHPSGRLHASVQEVRGILDCARLSVELAAVEAGHGAPASARLHRAEQVLLLTALAANSGARRGELASLRLGDLDGDILTISRSTSNEILGRTKSGRIRRLTLGHATAGLWRDMVDRWQQRNNDAPFGPWLFAARPDHSERLKTMTAGHWFDALASEAGHPDVTLHRLRHSAATHLVSRGDLLHAQYRLGHTDLTTTLRIYSHATPLTDSDAAEALERLYQ